MYAVLISFMCAARPSHLIRFDMIMYREQNVKLLIMQMSSSSCHLLSLFDLNIFLYRQTKIFANLFKRE
jgi:hypothetical protein